MSRDVLAVPSSLAPAPGQLPAWQFAAAARSPQARPSRWGFCPSRWPAQVAQGHLPT